MSSTRNFSEKRRLKEEERQGNVICLSILEYYMNYFITNITDEEIKREKAKARILRKSQWWKRKCAEGLCYYCKKKVAPKELTLDHIVPVVRGGKSTKGNIVPVCKECNSKKKYLLPVEWQEYLESLTRENPHL